jgi:hypothetical protein
MTDQQRGDEHHVQVQVRVAHPPERGCGDEHDARSEPVEPVDQVDGVHHHQHPDHHQRSAQETQFEGRSERVRQQRHAVAEVHEHHRRAGLDREFGPRPGAAQVVHQTEREHRDRSQREPEQGSHIQLARRPGQYARQPCHAQHRHDERESPQRWHRHAVDAARSGVVERAHAARQPHH